MPFPGLYSVCGGDIGVSGGGGYVRYLSNFTFIVPHYSTMTVRVWGGGATGATFSDNPAANGYTSSFNTTLIANGAKGGKGNIAGGTGGAGGTASGGDVNTTGGAGGGSANPNGVGNGGDAPNGGLGGIGVADYTIGGAGGGGAPGGGGGAIKGCGGGGAGGYASKTYTPGILAWGTLVPVVVAPKSPPSPGSPGVYPGAGGGAQGLVEIVWDGFPQQDYTSITGGGIGGSTGIPGGTGGGIPSPPDAGGGSPPAEGGDGGGGDGGGGGGDGG